MTTGKLIKIFTVLFAITAVAAIVVGIIAFSEDNKSLNNQDKQETVVSDTKDNKTEPLQDEALVPDKGTVAEVTPEVTPEPVAPVAEVKDPEPEVTPEPVSQIDDTYKDSLLFDGTQEHFITWNINYQVNVRAEASKESEKIGELKKDDYGIVLEKGEEFTKIQHKDMIGYVANQYLMTGKAADEKILGTSERIITIAKAVNIRDAASMDSNVLGMASAGNTFGFDPEAPEVHGWIAIVYGDYPVAYVSAAFCVDEGT